ncbi:MAG: CDP-alcohol phosphatidyltransferase family protein, partial [Bacteroidota bacterium]
MMKQLPNFFTLLNLFSGCVALIGIFYGFYFHAAIAIIVSLFADFMDGYTARYLKAYSLFGKELDSLADMVTFGIVPGAIFFKLLMEIFQIESDYHFSDYIYALPGFIFTLFAAIR